MTGVTNVYIDEGRITTSVLNNIDCLLASIHHHLCNNYIRPFCSEALCR